MKLIRKIKAIQERIIAIYECMNCKGKGTFHHATSGTMPDICCRCNGTGMIDIVESVTESEQDMK